MQGEGPAVSVYAEEGGTDRPRTFRLAESRPWRGSRVVCFSALSVSTGRDRGVQGMVGANEAKYLHAVAKAHLRRARAESRRTERVPIASPSRSSRYATTRSRFFGGPIWSIVFVVLVSCRAVQADAVELGTSLLVVQVPSLQMPLRVRRPVTRYPVAR